MEKQGKEFRGQFVARNPLLNYLPEEDRYLSSINKPRYRFNVIGTGINGQEHMRVTMLEGRGTIHGIYDTNPLSIKMAKEMFEKNFPSNNLIVYDTLEAACNDPAVDGLIICTPNYTHLEIVNEAVKSGKHILLEKPMATTLQDAYAIMEIAQNYTGVFQIGLQYRYKAIYTEAIHEALERKTVGDIKTISIQEHRIPFLDKVSQWNKFPKYSGGTLVEKCCHYFDLLNLFAQSKPKQVYATGSMAVNFIDFSYKNEKSDIIDNAFVTIVYENGIRTTFNLCMFAPMFYEELIICGDEGRLKAYENSDYLVDKRPNNYLEILRHQGLPSRISYPSYPKDIEESGHSGGTYYEHQYFIDNIDKIPTTTATVEEGFWAVVVGAAAEHAVKTGQSVDIGEFLAEQGIVI